MLDTKVLLQHIDNLRRYRTSNFEPDWYKNYFAYENNAFVSFNTASNKLIKIPYKKRFFMNLPETKRQADAYENLLLGFKPSFSIYPNDLSSENNKKEARSMNKLLKLHYMDWDTENIFHKYVHLAIKYPVSFWEVSVENRWNPQTLKMQKVIVPRIGDAFDYLFDPRIPFEDNPVIVKIIRKTLREIKQFKEFSVPTIKSSNSPIDMKDMINNSKFGNQTAQGDLATVICYQAFEKTATGIDVQIIDLGGNRLDQKSYTNAEFYPIVPLQLSSGDIYQPSIVQNLIPINRSISLIANRIEDYMLKFVKGQYLIREGSDITFGDENGIKVYYSGEKPDSMPVPIFQPAVIDWFRQLFTISERYNINQVAMGLTPRGSQMRTSGQGKQAIETAQAQQKTPLDYLMLACKRIAQITMFYISEYTDEVTSFTFKSQGDDFESQKFIGEKYKDKLTAEQLQSVTVIPHNIRSLDVEIEDISDASFKVKRNDIMALALEFEKMPPVFQKLMMDLYKVGDTADLMEDLEKNSTLLDNPEFQALIEQARAGNMDPQTQQALSIVLKFLSQQSPVPTGQKLAGDMSMPPKPMAPTQPNQPIQPNMPMAGGK